MLIYEHINMKHRKSAKKAENGKKRVDYSLPQDSRVEGVKSKLYKAA
jgi:hypothetical protein